MNEISNREQAKMQLKFFFKLFSICLVTALFACNQTIDKKSNETNTMDPVSEVPEWLNMLVDAALPADSLNVWIPTGELATSSLIRVPRFPSLKRGEDKESSPFDIHPVNTSDVHRITGVRNEQQSFQIAIASRKELTGVTVKVTDLLSESGNKLNAGNIRIRYVRYVPVQRARSEFIWTARPEEVYGKEVSGFGAPDVVGDPLVDMPEVNVPAYRAQPIWFTLEIPKSAAPGTYQGKLVVHTDQYEEFAINLSVNVLQQTIPSPKEYGFFLDLWFNPHAVAVVNGLEPWSEEHWKQLEPYLKDLASRGAKTVTATIVPYPWAIGWLNGSRRSQTCIGYPSMVNWLRDASGNWCFDYSIFDRFVETCFRHGIDRRIDAFSLTAFEQKGKACEIVFRHKENNRLDTLRYQGMDTEYETIWSCFLRDFENHVKQKGWLDKTYLSFDEAPQEVIESILDIVGNSAPAFLNQFSIAGKKDTESLARSFSLFYSHLPESEKMPEKDEISTILEKRRNDAGKTTTFYLCGDPAHPNSFAFSPAVESRMIPWLAACYNLDGYLRWAYNSWSDKDPYKNPVFNFIQGDDYSVYPGKNGPVSSIRWELLKEGIEDFELLNSVDSKHKSTAIEMAVRNRDGRRKAVSDFENARRILLDIDK
jgi:hypothetical protein